MDHLVRSRQQGWRDRQAERFCGPEIDHQLELGGLLDGEITRRRPFEDFVDINRRAAKQITQVSAVRHEAPGVEPLPKRPHGSQATLSRDLVDTSDVGKEERLTQDEQSSDASLLHHCKRSVELLHAADANRNKAHPKLRSRLFKALQPVCIDRRRRVEEERDRRSLRQGLLQQLQNLATKLRAGDDSQPRDVAARTRETFDESNSNWVLGDRHDYGNRGGGLQHSHGYSVDAHHEEIDVEGNEFSSENGKLLHSALSESAFDRNVLPFDIAMLA